MWYICIYIHIYIYIYIYLLYIIYGGLLKYKGIPKSSISKGFSFISHPFGGTSTYGTPLYKSIYTCTWYTALFTEPVHQAFFPRSDMPLPRMCLLVFVVEIMGGVWIVEQPVSSLIRFHPRVLVTFSEFRVTWFECGFWQRIFFSQAWKGNQPIVYIYIYTYKPVHCKLQVWHVPNRSGIAHVLQQGWSY